jgi:pyruvate/2-oxoacid:ferredoxin oxidoreductase beta subunit
VLLSPCPAGWKSDPADTVELARLAVASGLFPLFEVFDGRRYRINERPDGTMLEEYFSRQRRFDSSSLDVDCARTVVADQWAYLEALEASFPATSRDGGQTGS